MEVTFNGPGGVGRPRAPHSPLPLGLRNACLVTGRVSGAPEIGTGIFAGEFERKEGYN